MSFGAGELMATATIFTIDDYIVEDSETFIVNLSSLHSYIHFVGDIVITIEDNDGMVRSTHL